MSFKNESDGQSITPEEVLADTKRRLRMFPIELEEKIPTLEKPLIIESACPGWQSRMWGPKEIYHQLPPGYQEGGVRYPAVPISIEDQANEDIEAVKAGAAVIHHHPRDPETGISVSAKPMDVPLLSEIYDRVLDEVDAVTLQHTWLKDPETGQIDYITHTQQLLERGSGNKYCQGAVVLFSGAYEKGDILKSVEPTQAGVEWLEKNGVKPIYQLFDTYSALSLKHLLVDTGISTWKPYVLNVHMGKHHAHTIHHDPWAALQLITNLNMVRETFPESIVGIYAGGRNWLPMTVLAIMLGADIVRVGIEECYWMWPHKDEVIQKNVDTVKMAVSIANMLGRPVVTDANEARKILGTELTST